MQKLTRKSALSAISPPHNPVHLRLFCTPMYAGDSSVLKRMPNNQNLKISNAVSNRNVNL